MTKEELLLMIVECYDHDIETGIYFREHPSPSLEGWFLLIKDIKNASCGQKHHSYIIKRMFAEGIIVPCAFHYWLDDYDQVDEVESCKGKHWYSLTTETIEYIRMMRIL